MAIVAALFEEGNPDFRWIFKPLDFFERHIIVKMTLEGQFIKYKLNLI
jgi:hypothetical protein